MDLMEAESSVKENEYQLPQDTEDAKSVAFRMVAPDLEDTDDKKQATMMVEDFSKDPTAAKKLCLEDSGVEENVKETEAVEVASREWLQTDK
ncbi:unnamed protein product [Linum trigynum]|uniref:Uncharacterized protein n=1 Tax=Linum trigynum TaxID=586398 RepID=A0AAV2E704_9ROSI